MMNRLLRAELLKLGTTRTFWVYVLIMLAFVPLALAQAIDNPGAGVVLDSSEGVRTVIAAGSYSGLLLAVIGILAMAGDFRHNTITATFLITPKRQRVVLAKLAASALVGVAIASAASLLTLGVALPWLSAKGVDLGAHTGDIGLVLLAVLAAAGLCAIVGVGFAALVPDQTLAVTTALLWTLIVEGYLLVSLAPEIDRWLPGGASSAMTADSARHSGLLPMWAGALLLAAYALAFAAAGTRRIACRDIT